MAFLIFVLVVSAVGITFVVVRNRPRTGMHASIDEFRREMRAIAPDRVTGRDPSDHRGRPDEQGAGRSG